jgi:hypothetical protein
VDATPGPHLESEPARLTRSNDSYATGRVGGRLFNLTRLSSIFYWSVWNMRPRRISPCPLNRGHHKRGKNAILKSIQLSCYFISSISASFPRIATTSPTDLPRIARASGETWDTVPLDGSASSSPTMRKVCLRPSSRRRTTVVPKRAGLFLPSKRDLTGRGRRQLPSAFFMLPDGFLGNKNAATRSPSRRAASSTTRSCDGTAHRHVVSWRAR